MSSKRYLRLLPSVMLVCGALLILKASGIVHDALAQTGAPAPADAMAPPPPPVNHDFADDDGEIATASQVDVLTNLSKRRSELDARQSQIQANADMLAATEARVDAKIAQLKTLQSQIHDLLVQRDAAQEQQVAVLVKTYSTMKAKDAARIFDSLSDDVLVPVAQGMKPDILAPVLAAMSPETAQKLTLKLANRLVLPDTTAAAAATAATPVGAAAGALPGPQAQAGPAPPAAPKPGG